MRWFCGGLALALTLALSGCADDDSASSDGKVTVVASFYPLAEAARQIGADRVDVRDLTPPGAEPHDLELTTDDAVAIQDADLVVVLGGDFQPGIEKAAARRSDGTVIIRDALDVTGDDPHVWLDPVLMGEVVATVREALSVADPDGAAVFARNATDFATRVGSLDETFRAGLRTCERGVIVTAHEAFGRLAARYGLEQEAIAGLSPETEPDPRHLAALDDLVSDEGVTTIFTEELVSSEVAQALAREAGVKTEVLSPLESEPERGDYVSVMLDNLAKLRAALGCK
jgi:zinc transport system substrate-binding protein